MITTVLFEESSLFKKTGYMRIQDIINDIGEEYIGKPNNVRMRSECCERVSNKLFSIYNYIKSLDESLPDTLPMKVICDETNNNESRNIFMAIVPTDHRFDEFGNWYVDVSQI